MYVLYHAWSEGDGVEHLFCWDGYTWDLSVCVPNVRSPQLRPDLRVFLPSKCVHYHAEGHLFAHMNKMQL